MPRRRSQLFNKAGLLVFGLLVAGSTVYALVLRTQPETQEPAREETQPPKMIKGGLGALTDNPVPRVWGRLTPVKKEDAAHPTKRVTITTPMIHIAGDPEPDRVLPAEIKQRRRARRAPTKGQPAAKPSAAPAGQLPPSGSSVMARFKAVPKPRENLPETPDRVDIVRVMGSIRSKVQDCYDTGMVPGRVDLVLVVAGETGHVSQARVSADSSTATCIRRVARTLRFPRFSRDQVTIRYPYAFR